MKNKSLILLFLCISVCNIINAQNVYQYNKEDSVIFQKYITEFSSLGDKPLNELVILTGKYFLGKPYVASTLENNSKEKLVINLRELDCTTFVENAIALSTELKMGKNKSFSNYMSIVQSLRYRQGIINGYASRIHYTSDWLYENRDVLDNITLELGGEIIEKPLSFMSNNSDLYPALKNNTTEIKKMKDIEQSVSKRKNYALLPVEKIKQAEDKIENGDIIIFGTSMKGLDYSHIGLAIWENNELKLLHASSAKKKVVIDVKTLVDYCKSSKTCNGITVLRLRNK